MTKKSGTYTTAEIKVKRKRFVCYACGEWPCEFTGYVSEQKTPTRCPLGVSDHHVAWLTPLKGRK